MADVGEFVRHHAGDLLTAEMAQQAGGRGHRGMLGIAAGGEGVGLLLVDHVDARHRQAGALRQALDDAVELGRLVGPDLLGIAHAQDGLVAVPVGIDVHAQRHDQRQHQAGAAAQQVADDQEDGGTKVVHGRKDGLGLWRIKARHGIMGRLAIQRQSHRLLIASVR